MIQQSHSYVYIYPEKMKTLIHKDICTPVFIDTPFTIAKTQKETKCPSTYPHRLAYKDVVCVCVCVCVCIMEYYTVIKRMKYCHLQQHG